MVLHTACAPAREIDYYFGILRVLFLCWLATFRVHQTGATAGGYPGFVYTNVAGLDPLSEWLCTLLKIGLQYICWRKTNTNPFQA